LVLALLAVSVTPARADEAAAAASISQIDTECGAIQNAIMALKPIHVALVNSKWKVLSDQDYAVAERTNSSITLADVWKQGSSYAWVHSHTIDSKGNQRATQLCFRQADGTLERARQATTVPELDAAAAKQAYYASDGSIIQKTSIFEVNDPAIAKKIAELPFYSVLP
jgi:hypothetical protein